MKMHGSRYALIAVCCLSLANLTACSSYSSQSDSEQSAVTTTGGDYMSRLPQTIGDSEKVVMVDPHVHAWGAYESGTLIKAGVASAGSNWCPDLGRPCHTSVGTFHVFSLGSADCKSSRFPIPTGGAPMPYCMYFNKSEALHGVSANEVGEGNFSHGCVRMHVSDAEWLRYNFVQMGTKVVVKPY